MQRILYRTPTPEALEKLFWSTASTANDANATAARDHAPSSSDDGGRDESELHQLGMGETAESVTVGAWVLAVFETQASSDSPPISVGPTSRPPASSRATCAPARVVQRADGSLGLQFSGPDWQRIASYARVRRESNAPNAHGHASERIRSARPVHLPSMFPAAPLPQVETMCILHWLTDAAAGSHLGEALGGSCHAFTCQDDLVRFAAAQKDAGQRIDAIVFQQSADDELIAAVRQLHEDHPGAVLLCLASGAKAQVMRALYEAGADELLQAQTSPSEVAVTLLALVRRRASKDTESLGAA